MTTHDASPTSSAASRAPVDIMVITLAHKRFGVFLNHFKEIIPLKTITRVCDAPYFIEGIIHHKEKTYFVMDMRSKLGLASPPETINTSIMLVDMLGVDIGLIVDSIIGSVRADREKIAPIPKIAGNPNYGYVLGTIMYNGKSLIVIEINKLLSISDKQALSSMWVPQKAIHKSIRIAQGM